MSAPHAHDRRQDRSTCRDPRRLGITSARRQVMRNSSPAMAVTLAVVGLVGWSCKREAAAPPVASDVTSKAPAPPSAPPAAPSAPSAAPAVDAEATAELIVGSERGLEAWKRDGSGKRVISPGVALHPRWLDKTTVLVVKADDT